MRKVGITNRRLFRKPKHKRLADIISIRSPDSARQSIKDAQRTSYSKATLKRSYVLASNRAMAIRHKKDLSIREKKEMLEVARIYKSEADKL